MKIIWNKVTWYSKFLVLFFLVFLIWFGLYYLNVYRDFISSQQVFLYPRLFKEGNVEFQYPKDFVLLKEDFGYSFEEKINGVSLYPYYFYLNDDAKRKEIDSLRNTNYQKVIYGSMKPSDLDWDTIEVGNIPQDGIGTAGGDQYAYIDRDGKSYIFRCINCAPEVFGREINERRINFVDIISTFKFTK